MAWPTASDVATRAGATLSSAEWTTTAAVSSLLTNAKALAAAHCGRDPRYGFDEASVTEKLDGGCLTIPVIHPPIQGSATVVWDTDTLSESNEEFYAYDDYIRIVESDKDDLEPATVRPRYRKYVTLTYTGGFSDSTSGARAIPTELKDVVLEMATRALMKIDQQYRQDGNPKKLQVGEYNVTWKEDDVLFSDLLRRLDRLGGSVNVFAGAIA